MYRHLYVDTADDSVGVVLHMGLVSADDWRIAARNPSRKDIRLFTLAGDVLVFRDGYLVT
jgi:hypothetical protein